MIASVHDLRAILGIEGGDKDALLSRILKSAQKYAENFTARQFEENEVAEKFLGDGSDFMYLQKAPLSIDYGASQYVKVDGDIVAEEDVKVYGEDGQIVLLNGEKFTEDKEIEIKFNAGWAAGNVPDDLVNAVLELAAATYRDSTSGVIAEKKVGDFTVKYAVGRNVSMIVQATLDEYVTKSVC